MADNVIKVSVTSTKSQRVSVSSSQQATNITASPDTGRFWSQTSKNWAVSETIVDGEDYSSKYYANKSKQSAQNAEGYLQSTREIYNTFVSDANGYVNELTELKDAGVEEINEAVASGKDEINSTKTTILNDIEFVADGEKKEIEDLIDSGKEELKESIGDVKVLTTLEIGDIGFTQMAIDESKGKRRILNGQIIIQEQYVQFTNIVKNSVALNSDLACTEAEWQTELTMSANGVCYKFVIDDEAGTIRLPKYPEYLDLSINGAKSVSVYGNGKTLGLMTGSGVYGLFADNISSAYTISHSSAYYNKTLPYNGGATAGDKGNDGLAFGLTNDPSSSGITGSVTISSEQIKGQYFIQVATGAETEDNIINEIELNNPFSLLDYKYSEYELNNLSWLRSQGQYNSKAIYPAVYDLLLKIYNGTETKAGVSVKLATETFTDYDFVLNTTDETFRLPTKVKLASGKAVVGNGITLGLESPYQKGALAHGSNGAVYVDTIGYGQPSSIVDGTAGGFSGDNTWLSVTTDPTKSGIETSDSDLYLYFYVGETVQNANLINAGRIEEKIASLIPNNQNVWDGQWVRKVQTLSTAYTAGTYTLDLSSYLPNDGHIYEVLIHGHMVGTSNPSWSRVSSSLTSEIRFCMANNAQWAQNSFIIPIGVDRKLTYIIINGAGSDIGLYASCYRRVGTNQ